MDAKAWIALASIALAGLSWGVSVEVRLAHASGLEGNVAIRLDQYADHLNWIGDSLEELAKAQGVHLPKRPLVVRD